MIKKSESIDDSNEEDYEHNPFIFGVPKFRIEKNDGIWQTIYKNQHGGSVYDNGIFHPYYEMDEVLIQTLQTWITKEVPSLCEGSLPTIHCHYETKIIIKQSNMNLNIENNMNHTQIYRCSPSYRKKEWFDWVHVEYEDRYDSSRKHLVPAQIYLWLHLYYEDEDIEDGYFVLAWPMSSTKTPSYPILDCLGYDKLYQKPYVFNAIEVKGPTIVVPAVTYNKTNGYHISKSERNQFLCRDKTETYFMCIPRRDLWHDIGWTSKDYIQIRNTLNNKTK